MTEEMTVIDDLTFDDSVRRLTTPIRWPMTWIVKHFGKKCGGIISVYVDSEDGKTRTAKSAGIYRFRGKFYVL